MASPVTYVLLVILWSGWCWLHSYLISTRFTAFLETIAGSYNRYFRLGYNVFALLSLMPPVLFTLSIRSAELPLFIWQGWYDVLRYGLLGVALLFFAGGAHHYDLLHFSGITQIRSERHSPLLTSSAQFEPDGFLGVVRHPWYLGGIILVWTISSRLYPSTILVATIISIYFVVGTILEEKKLVARYGDEYRVYQHQVSMLLPVKWFGRLFRTHRKGE